MKIILFLVLLLTSPALGADFTATCSPDQVNFFCPQTISSNSNVNWTGVHSWIQGISVSSSISASGEIVAGPQGFSGLGYNIYGTGLAYSSAPVGAVSLSTTNFVALAASSVTLRGGPARRVMFIYNASLTNSTGGQRTYTLAGYEGTNGLTAGFRQTILAGDTETTTFFRFLSTHTFSPGVSTFTIKGLSNNASGTQTASDGQLTIVEF